MAPVEFYDTNVTPTGESPHDTLYHLGEKLITTT